MVVCGGLVCGGVVNVVWRAWCAGGVGKEGIERTSLISILSSAMTVMLRRCGLDLGLDVRWG